MNSLNDEHVRGFSYFSTSLCDKPSVRSRYLTRFQRASKGAYESAGSGGHQIIYGRRMWLNGCWIYIVVSRNF